MISYVITVTGAISESETTDRYDHNKQRDLNHNFAPILVVGIHITLI